MPLIVSTKSADRFHLPMRGAVNSCMAHYMARRTLPFNAPAGK